MYELIKAIGKTYYIDSPSRIGLFRLSNREVCLIDSGNNKEAGKKIKKVLDGEGWNLTAIYITHSHADHIGGNNYLKSQYGCKIFAHETECDFTRHTVLEPAFLYGANPPEELRHKFLLAEASHAEILSEDDLPDGFTAFEIPGHFFDMVGYRTPDDVVFIADCLSSKEILEKYGIGYIYDIKAYLNSLEKVKRINAALFIPSHAPVTDDIVPLADYNIMKVNEVCDAITELCSTPKTTEEILAELFEKYSLNMNFEQYALVGSATRSYLTYLASESRVLPFFDKNKLFFERI